MRHKFDLVLKAELITARVLLFLSQAMTILENFLGVLATQKLYQQNQLITF